MSVLNFPRIYLNGHMFWNPPTANNNDVYPLYDAVNADINWPFMSHFDINATNAPTQLMPWAIKPLTMAELPAYMLQVPTNANPGTYPYMPAEWDLFGDNACGTVSYKGTRSTIIGGELQADTYITEDALVGRDYQLLGNPFGSNAPTAARFVDVSPWQNTFTALYFDKLMLGDTTCGLTLNRQYRMMDRFLNFNWGAFGGLVYVTTTWQSCFPQENLEWVIGDSALLSNLQQQMKLQGAKGLMFRFSTYLTCYDRNGVFNDFPYVNTRSNAPSDTARLQAMYQKGLDNVSGIFFNPAYSRTAATLGLWFADEYPTAPAGLRLVPVAPVPLIQMNPPRDVAPAKLGVVSAQVTGNTLSLDLTNTFPFYPVDPTAPILTAEKFQAGDYQLGVREGDQFTPVADFGYEQYRQSAFDERSGLLDFALNDDKVKALQSGTLELQRKSPAPATPVTAAAQQTWTAEVIESGSFIDVGDHKTLTIMVQKNGQPAANTTLWVAEYGNPYMVTTSDYYLASSNGANFTLFFNHPSDPNLNKANLPHFNDTPPVQNYLAEGSGRRLTALRKMDQPSGDPIGYQQFLQGEGKPVTIDLHPCLAFDAGVYATGTLSDDVHATPVDYSYVATTTDANGIAQVSFRAVAPGFPTCLLYTSPSPRD